MSDEERQQLHPKAGESIEEEILKEQEEELRQRQKIRVGLYQVKIRLYSIQYISRNGRDYPTGQFQGFFLVDTRLDSNGEPDLSYWLTAKEIERCKREMHLAFHWGDVTAEVLEPEFGYQGELTAYFNEEDYRTFERGAQGIPFKDELVTIKYGASEFRRIRGFETPLTIEDLVLGLSSMAPIAEDKLQGAIVKRLLVIKDEIVDWDSGDENYPIYIPTDEDIERVNSE